MSKYPHIKNNLLLVLENSNLTYLDESDNGCSLVVRLAPATVNGKNLPLRFEKQGRIINGRIDNQVSHEENIFREIKNQEQSGIYIKKIVNRIEYIQRNDDYVLITKDVGVDIDIWQNIRLYLRYNNRSYQNIFCHPLILLHFVKGTLLAFKNIHQVGLYHCDIKHDQICIPFTKDGNAIVVNPDDVSLIDFGIAIWKMTPVASRNPVRFTSQNIKNDDYVATTLIKAGDYQAHLYKTTGEYDFNQLINQIDCAVDLYSFGFLLNSLEITQYPEDRQAWRSFINKYHEWVDELLALSDKPTPFKNNLPHDDYIKQINSWISGVNEILGITVNQLVFEIKDNNRDSTPPVRSRPTPTPTPFSNVRELNSTPPVTPPVIQQDNSQDRQMWQTVSKKDTLDGYEEYVSAFPDGIYLKEAYERIIALKEEKRFFDNCCRENTTESYATYLIKYPNGKYVARVNDRISNIKKREVIKQSQNDEFELWNIVSEKDEIAGYEEYLNKYPNGEFIWRAKGRINSLKQIGSEKQPQNNSSSHTKNTNTDQKSNIQSQNDEIKRKMLLDDFSKYQKKDILINKVQVWLILFSCSIYPNMIYNKFSLLGLFIVGLTMLPLLIDIFIQVNKLKISVLSYFSLNREGALLFTTMLLITSSLIMGMINNNGYQEFPHFKVDGHYGTSIILIFFGGFLVFHILQDVVEKSMRLGSYLAQSQFFTKNNPNPKIQVARENGIVLKGELICKINDISYYAEQDGYLHIMDGLYKGLENYIFTIHRLHKWDK